MIISNRCPHSIAISGSDGVTRIIDPDGPAVRIETEPGAQVGTIDTVPVHAPPRFLGVLNLPPPRPDTVYVVSQLAALAIGALMPERTDVVYPGTAPCDQPRRIRRGLVSVSRLIRAV